MVLVLWCTQDTAALTAQGSSNGGGGVGKGRTNTNAPLLPPQPMPRAPDADERFPVNVVDMDVDFINQILRVLLCSLCRKLTSVSLAAGSVFRAYRRTARKYVRARAGVPSKTWRRFVHQPRRCSR